MIIFGKPIHTHNILCYVFMLLGVGLIWFAIKWWGWFDDELLGTLGVLSGCAMLWLGWESRHK
jgi:hypothetical protein